MFASIFSGGVLACGTLLVAAGAAKLSRFARRAEGDSAIRAALRIRPRRWSRIEAAAGAVETATGVAVCAAFHPVVAGVVLAVEGALFSGLLAYARRVRALGGCGCVRRPRRRDSTIGWPVQARAAWLLVAGIGSAVARLPRPTPSAGGALVVVAGIVVLWLMLNAEEPWATPACRLVVRRGYGQALRALREHGVFATMAASVGPFAEDFAHRREGCVDEFRFVAAPRAGRAEGRTVVFRVARGGLAVEARVVSTPS